MPKVGSFGLPSSPARPMLLLGDCRQVLPRFGEGTFDALVTDPPYELGFMGKSWDQRGVAFDPATWRSVLRVLKPGGYGVVFGGTRTYHRIACAVEDAGFEIRDCLMYMYGTGFPKGKGCLKPAYEPILLCRKPGKRVLPLGIDGCRVEGTVPAVTGRGLKNGSWRGKEGRDDIDDSLKTFPAQSGRYPANVAHDGSDEVQEAFAAFGEKKTGDLNRASGSRHSEYGMGDRENIGHKGSTGSAARFFYCAKASRRERGEGNGHPTVKPLALMCWLVRLVCGEGGLVVEPFLGSGTTALACMAEGRRCVGIEENAEYLKIARNRLLSEQTTAR